MQEVSWIILTTCAVVVTIGLVPLLLSLRRSSMKAELGLDLINRELPGTLVELRHAAEEARETLRVARRTGEHLERTTAQAEEAAETALSFVAAQSGRLSRLVMMVTGIVKGVRVATEVYRREHSDHGSGNGAEPLDETRKKEVNHE